MSDNNMNTIWFVNSTGNGFAEKVNMPAGCTIEDLFIRKIGSMSAPTGFTIVLRRGTTVYGGNAAANSFPLDKNFPLQDGDKVSMVAVDMKSA